jgi:site-specific recombinase XerD
MNLRIYLRQRPNAKGECSIYFIVNDEWISTGIRCHPDHWDGNNSILKKSHPNFYQVNAIYNLYRSRAELCVANFQIAGTGFSKKYFETFVFNDPAEAENPGFLNLIDEYCNTINLGWQRIKHYQVLKKNISSLATSHRIKDINYNFALRLQQLLRVEQNNANTISRKMRMLKAVVHYAQKCGHLNNDPLINIKIKAIQGTKHFLSAVELQQLEQLYKDGMLNFVQQNVLRYFLFSCYTGLRYSDVVGLKYYDIKEDCVCTTQEKTDKPVKIPLIKKAKDLLQVASTGLIFKTHSNQVSNRSLKYIVEKAGIDKPITFHCSRHTFATLSIYWGIPKEVVAELMGVDFKTVEIYAKIMDEVKQREMQKWEMTAS